MIFNNRPGKFLIYWKKVKNSQYVISTNGRNLEES